jgi:hemerythrin superfamily protein
MPRRSQGATAPKKGAKKAQPIDAIKLLKEDHQKVSRLFEECLNAPPDGRGDLAEQIFHELEIHSTLEEELFYPALQSEGDMGELGSLEQGDAEINGQDVLNEAETEDEDEDDADVDDEESNEEVGEDVVASAYEDHQAVKEMIGRLRTLDPTGDDFRESMTELKDMVTDHVEEEEEVLFPEAQLKLDIKTIGMKMQERKQDLMASKA